LEEKDKTGWSSLLAEKTPERRKKERLPSTSEPSLRSIVSSLSYSIAKSFMRSLELVAHWNP
jgi:hypothetical protein